MRIDKPVLFVVGSGRSGTTLLYELLCAHPAAAWVSNYSQRFPHLSWCHPRVPRAAKGAMSSRWSPRPVEGYRMYDRARPVSAPGDPPLGAADLTTAERNALRLAVATHLRAGRRSFFVNKNTRNTRRVRYLAAAFPEARFAHIVRHPVATAASMARVAFFPDLELWWHGARSVRELVASGARPEVLAAELWARETEICHHALRELPPRRSVELRYEDLVARPLELLADVVDLVGESLSSSMRSEVATRAISNRNDVAFTLMDPRVRALVWETAAPTAARYGYEPV